MGGGLLSGAAHRQADRASTPHDSPSRAESAIMHHNSQASWHEGKALPQPPSVCMLTKAPHTHMPPPLWSLCSPLCGHSVASAPPSCALLIDSVHPHTPSLTQMNDNFAKSGGVAWREGLPVLPEVNLGMLQ